MWIRFKSNEELKLEMDEVVKAVTVGVRTISSTIRKTITIDACKIVELNIVLIDPRFISSKLWKYYVASWYSFCYFSSDGMDCLS